MRKLTFSALVAGAWLVVWIVAAEIVVHSHPASPPSGADAVSMARQGGERGAPTQDGRALGPELPQTGEPESQLVVEPLILMAELPVGAQQVQHLTIGNDGLTATLHYSISVFPGSGMAGIVEWLKVAPVLGSVAPKSQATVEVTFIPMFYMEAGSLHQAAILVDSDSVTEPVSITLPSLLWITPPPVQITPGSLSVELLIGGTDERRLTVSNQGNNLLTFTVSTPAPVRWLTLSPPGGTLEVGESSYVTATVDAGAMSAGLYSADLVFESYSGFTFPMTVPLEVQVVPWLVYVPLVLGDAP